MTEMVFLSFSCVANQHEQCTGTLGDLSVCACVCHKALQPDWVVGDPDITEEEANAFLHALEPHEPTLHELQAQVAQVQVEDIEDIDVLLTAITNASDMLARLSNTAKALGVEDQTIITAMKEWPHLNVINEAFED